MDSSSSFSFTFTGFKVLDIILNGLVVVALYAVGVGVYRLYLSPLARFPGPKLAALTQWYETYYDVYLDGKFLLHMEQLHKTYGSSSLL